MSEQETQNKIIVSQKYEAPLPPPQYLEVYENIHPGAAKIIFDSYELSTKKVLELREKELDNQYRLANRNQLMAFVLALLSFALLFVGALLDNQLLTGGAIAIFAANIIKSFINKRK